MRYALRSLLKNPGFTLVAVLTMAVAIGACTALFSVLQAVILRPLPYPEPERLVSIWGLNQERDFEAQGLSWAKYEQFRERKDVFQDIAMSVANGFTLTEGTGDPEQVFGLHVSANFLPLLGLSPSVGRNFTADEDQEGAPAVAMIGPQLWRNRFGGDPNIIGRVVQFDGVPREIVGILPERMPVPFNTILVLVPRPLEVPFLSARQRDHAIVHAPYARLAPGVTLEQANRRIAEMVQQFRTDNPGHIDSQNDNEVRTIEQQVFGDLRQPFWTLAGAVAAVLLIASANVANLFLARVSARQKEIAVRMSLGAGRSTVVRQFLTESLLFTGVAAVLGILMAWWSLQGIAVLAGPQLPRGEEIHLDPFVLLFAVGIAVISGLFIGFYPALQASRTDVHAVLKETSRGAGGSAAAKAFRHALLVTQVALSLTLLIGAGLLVLSFHRLQSADIGFKSAGRATGLITLPNARYSDQEASREFFRRLQEKLDQTPELAHGGAIFGLPLSGLGTFSPYSVRGRPILPLHERPLASIRFVTPGYFRTMGIRLKEGRFIEAGDRFGHEVVAVINESFARKLFPGESAVGQAFLIGPNTDQVVRIVGVIGDVKANGLAAPPPDEIYYARDQRGNAYMTVVGQAQPGFSSAAVIPVLRRLLSELDPTLALATPQTLDAAVEQSIGVQRVTMALLLTFASIAALLAAVGVYSVMAYTVTQRTGEIGVRMALGATTGNILRLVLRTGAIQLGTGLVLGLGGAVASSRLLQKALYEVKPFDPVVFLAVATGFALVGAIACLVPARRATQVDPMTALRSE